MTRDVSSPTQTAAGAKHSRPGFFLQIDWSGFSSRLCSFDAKPWNDFEWVGSAFQVSSFEKDGKPEKITILDPDGSFRTLALADKIRDRTVQLWMGYMDALADDDPVLIFKGAADGFDWANGRMSFGLDWHRSAKQFTPRDSITPAIGVNWTAIPGTTVTWGDRVFKLEARSR